MKRKSIAIILAVTLAISFATVPAANAAGETLRFQIQYYEGEDNFYTISNAVLSSETVMTIEWTTGNIPWEEGERVQRKVYYVLDGVSIVKLAEGGWDLPLRILTMEQVDIDDETGQKVFRVYSRGAAIFPSDIEAQFGYTDELLLTRSAVYEYDPADYYDISDYMNTDYDHLDNMNYFAVGDFVIKLVEALPDTPTSTTPDSPSSWAADLVNEAIAANLVPQHLQSNYTQATTRAEFAALAVTLYENITGEEIETGANPFTDTSDINVQKAAAIGIVQGTNPAAGIFSPDNELTREMAATLLSNLSAALGHTLPRHTASFDDMSGAAAWAVEAIGQMQAAEIMSGSNNRFMPRNPYAREQSIITMLLLHGVVTREIGEDT